MSQFQGLTSHLALQLLDNHSRHAALVDAYREELVLQLSGATSGTKERKETAIMRYMNALLHYKKE